MASCQAKINKTGAPCMTLEVWESSQNSTTVTLSYKLSYSASYPASDARDKSYTINIGGTPVTGTFNINNKTGTHQVKTGSVTVNRNTSAYNCACSISFAVNITWSGTYYGTVSGNTSVSIGVKYYTITYNTTGGSTPPASQTKYHNVNLDLSRVVPTKTGYTCQGWALTNGGDVYYTLSDWCGRNENLTLFAVWKPNEFAVSYNMNGGTGGPANQIKKYGIDLRLTSNGMPTKTNYNFLGWSTSQNGSIIAYNPGDYYRGNSALILYAVWELAYSKPRISEVTAKRMIFLNNEYVEDDEGSIIQLIFDWATDRDISNIVVTYTDGTTTESHQVTSPYSGTSGSITEYIGTTGDGITSETSWKMSIIVTDSLDNNNYDIDIQSAKASIDVCTDGEEVGVAVGKTAEEVGKFDVGLELCARKPSNFHADANFHNKVMFDAQTLCAPVIGDLDVITNGLAKNNLGSNNGLIRCGNLCQITVSFILYDMPTITPWSTNVIFNLPYGFRPPCDVVCKSMTDGSQDVWRRDNANFEVFIRPNGDVTLTQRGGGEGIDFNSHRGEWGTPGIFISAMYITTDNYPEQN